MNFGSNRPMVVRAISTSGSDMATEMDSSVVEEAPEDQLNMTVWRLVLATMNCRKISHIPFRQCV